MCSEKNPKLEDTPMRLGYIYVEESQIVYDLRAQNLTFVAHMPKQRPSLEWIGNQPTHCSLMPESEAAVQLHT